METSGASTEGFRNSAPRRYGMQFSAANIIQAPLTALLEYSGLLRGRSHHHESEATTGLTSGNSLRDHHPSRVDDAGSAEVSIRIIGAGEQEHVRVGASAPLGSHGRNGGETDSGNSSNNHLQSSSTGLQSSQGTGGVDISTSGGGPSSSISPLTLSAGGNAETDAVNNNNANGRDTAYQRYDIQQLARWIEQILPFSLLLLVVFIRQHLQEKVGGGGKIKEKWRRRK